VTTKPSAIASNGRAISVQQASLKTAAVTIKALVIDRRQVTLAVFRQLIEEPLVDAETGRFNGLPWGRVNYHPQKRCASAYAPFHLHVIWQKGEELRRATEHAPPPFEVSPDLDRLTDCWGVLAYGNPSTSHINWVSASRGKYARVSFAEELPWVPCRIEGTVASSIDLLKGPPPDLPSAEPDCTCGRSYGHDADCEYRRWVDVRDEYDRRARARATAEAAWHEVGRRAGTNAIDEIADAIRNELRKQIGAYGEHVHRWQELQALDQLFIAT
jgi:hypothetical protein